MKVATLRSSSVELRVIPGKGRGVTAIAPIAKGELLEIMPVLRLTEAEEAAISDTALGSYVFLWEETDAETGTRYPYALVMGVISLLNHSRRANTGIDSDFAAQTMRLEAKRDIAVGEELTIDYDCELWFEEQE